MGGHQSPTYFRDYYVRNRAKKLAYQSKYRKTEAGRANKNAAQARHRGELRAVVQRTKDVPCADCGRRYPSYVMDFDHRRGKKRMVVARMAAGGYSVASVLAEIAKCDVVCANCHRIRTYGPKLRAVG